MCADRENSLSLYIYVCWITRCSLCNLYNWRYKKLGNLPHVSLLPEYQAANAGFAFDYQLIDVQDFNGVGESEPNPYFYQVRWPAPRVPCTSCHSLRATFVVGFFLVGDRSTSTIC